MEQCPADKALLRDVWEMHGEALSELRSITEEGASILAEALEVDVLQQTPERMRAAAGHQISPMLPYGKIEKILPPDVFGPIEKADSHTLPRTFIGRALMNVRHVRSLSQKMRAANDEPGYYYKYSPRLNEGLPKKIRSISREQPSVDKEKWALYQEAAELQKLQGLYWLELAQDFRGMSAAFLYNTGMGANIRQLASGKFDYFKAAMLNVDSQINTPADFIVLPVGEYGKAFTEKLIRSTVMMSQTATDVLPSWSQNVVEAHPETIMHMSRVRNAGKTPEAVVANIREGMLSIAQTLALLTAEKVPGYETGEELAQAIIDNGLVEQFTRAVPIGFIGPVSNEGIFVPGLLEVRDGKMRLNPDALDAIKVMKRWQIQEAVAQWTVYQATKNPDPKDMPEAFGLICPAAMGNGAVSRMLKPMVRALHDPNINSKDVLVDTATSY